MALMNAGTVVMLLVEFRPEGGVVVPAYIVFTVMFSHTNVRQKCTSVHVQTYVYLQYLAFVVNIPANLFMHTHTCTCKLT